MKSFVMAVSTIFYFFVLIPGGVTQSLQNDTKPQEKDIDTKVQQSNLPILEIISYSFVEKLKGEYQSWENSNSMRTGLILTVASKSSSSIKFKPSDFLLQYTIESETFDEECLGMNFGSSKEPTEDQWYFVSPGFHFKMSGEAERYIHLFFVVGKKIDSATLLYSQPVVKTKTISIKKK